MTLWGARNGEGATASAAARAPFPPGILGLATGEHPRYYRTQACLTELRLATARYAAQIQVRGYDAGRNRNTIIRRALTSHGAWEWLFWMDDDHLFDPSLLTSLLTHWLLADRPARIYAGLYNQRLAPFRPVIAAPTHGRKRFRLIDWGEVPNPTTTPVWALPLGWGIGCASMLVPRVVFERVRSPWYWLGQFDPRGTGEDLYFCAKAARAGIGVSVDLTQTFTHLTEVALTPEFSAEAGWGVRLDVEGGLSERLDFERTAIAQEVP
jgi:hypothetical protein